MPLFFSHEENVTWLCCQVLNRDRHLACLPGMLSTPSTNGLEEAGAPNLLAIVTLTSEELLRQGLPKCLKQSQQQLWASTPTSKVIPSMKRIFSLTWKKGSVSILLRYSYTQRGNFENCTLIDAFVPKLPHSKCSPLCNSLPRENGGPRKPSASFWSRRWL